jgi:hypothetical protein
LAGATEKSNEAEGRGKECECECECVMLFRLALCIAVPCVPVLTLLLHRHELRSLRLECSMNVMQLCLSMVTEEHEERIRVELRGSAGLAQEQPVR